MKVHIVVAHPEKDSFNFALYHEAVNTFKNKNIAIDVSDLYRQNFNPVAGQNDFQNFPSEEHFQLAKAQRWAIANGTFTKSIVQEQNKLSSSDLLIFQFPLWWWSFPAILKGWIDRVLTSGFAYGKDSTLKPKRVMFSITTGGAGNAVEHEYYQNKINGLYQDIFGFIGWEILPAFIAHGVQQKTNDELIKILEEYKAHLLKHATTFSITYNENDS